MPGEDQKEQKAPAFRAPEQQDWCRREWGPACSETDLSGGVSASRPLPRPLPVSPQVSEPPNPSPCPPRCWEMVPDHPSVGWCSSPIAPSSVWGLSAL